MSDAIEPLDDPEEEAWDREIERDFAPGGPGERLLVKVDEDIAAGRTRPLEAVLFSSMDSQCNPLESLRVEVETEEDGRFLAFVPDLPGVMAYGETREEAIRKATSIALLVLADP